MQTAHSILKIQEDTEESFWLKINVLTVKKKDTEQETAPRRRGAMVAL